MTSHTCAAKSLALWRHPEQTDPAMMTVRARDVMRVRIEDVLSTYQQSAAASLVFPTDSLRRKPMQNTAIGVERRILHEEISEFMDAKSEA